MKGMEDLNLLRERVVVGTTVHVINHDYIKDSGTRKVLILSENLYGTGKPGFISGGDNGRRFHFTWPTKDSDFEVDGNELRVYNPSHAYVGGCRAITLTMKFVP